MSATWMTFWKAVGRVGQPRSQILRGSRLKGSRGWRSPRCPFGKPLNVMSHLEHISLTKSAWEPRGRCRSLGCLSRQPLDVVGYMDCSSFLKSSMRMLMWKEVLLLLLRVPFHHFESRKWQGNIRGRGWKAFKVLMTLIINIGEIISVMLIWLVHFEHVATNTVIIALRIKKNSNWSPAKLNTWKMKIDPLGNSWPDKLVAFVRSHIYIFYNSSTSMDCLDLVPMQSFFC